jgi:hypothetical protein
MVLFGHTDAVASANMGTHKIRGLVSASTTEHSRIQRKREERAFSLLDVEVDPTGSGRVNVSHHWWNDSLVTYC